MHEEETLGDKPRAYSPVGAQALPKSSCVLLTGRHSSGEAPDFIWEQAQWTLGYHLSFVAEKGVNIPSESSGFMKTHFT